MEESLRWRMTAIICLLGILSGLFILAGTVEPNTADNNYPGINDIYDNPEQYVGDRVSVGGTVIKTDPLTIEDEPVPGETISFVVDNAAVDAAVGDNLMIYGTLGEHNHVDAINTIHREPWEVQYMYVVSFIAGLWVLGRLLNRWTIDTTAWTVVSRTDPLFTIGN